MEHKADEAHPNILLLMTDQQRGDCLGIENTCPVQTPYLDELAMNGIRFNRAYSACPVCVPARRTLMTGQRPRTHGLLTNGWSPLAAPTLPHVLAEQGYHTHLVGKLHFQPARALFGFHSADWADGPWQDGTVENDYFRYLRQHGIDAHEATAHGMSQNGYPVRPWHLDEKFHFSNWCTTRALDFLERRDPTRPFFLKVSYLHPHQPLTPPRDYFERYLREELPEPYVGDWARLSDEPMSALPVDAWRIALRPGPMRELRAAYYASVNHVDNQIGRILRRIPKNTVVLFCSDHGEMLGDHQWLRKRTPYEPSARIPMLLRLPESLAERRGIAQGQTVSAPVELMDVMPTLLDAVGVEAPSTVEGSSLLSLVSERASVPWREYLHGECAQIPTMNGGMHYLTDGKRKYIWYPGVNQEQFFNLENDPQEMVDLTQSPAHEGEVIFWRTRLSRELRSNFLEKPLRPVTDSSLPHRNGAILVDKLH
ncbi:MAG: arylsulfatase [Armatimonadaceae bacterium]